MRDPLLKIDLLSSLSLCCAILFGFISLFKSTLLLIYFVCILLMTSLLLDAFLLFKTFRTYESILQLGRSITIILIFVWLMLH